MALSNLRNWSVWRACVTEIQAIKNRQARFQEKPKTYPSLSHANPCKLPREIRTWTKIEKGLSNQHLNSQRKIGNVFLESRAFAHNLVLPCFFLYVSSSLSWLSQNAVTLWGETALDQLRCSTLRHIPAALWLDSWRFLATAKGSTQRLDMSQLFDRSTNSPLSPQSEIVSMSDIGASTTSSPNFTVWTKWQDRTNLPRVKLWLLDVSWLHWGT